MLRIARGFALLTLVSSALPAQAGQIFIGNLDGPFVATASPGLGFGVVSVDDFFNMSIDLGFFDLQGVATSASLSAGGFFPLTLPVPSDTSGFVSGVFVIDGGVLAALLGGNGTFLIGSTAFPGGEIGGPLQLTDGPKPKEDVPEPATLVAAGLGLVVLAFWERHRRV